MSEREFSEAGIAGHPFSDEERRAQKESVFVDVHRSDLEKVRDALQEAVAFHVHRDEMNARIHLAQQVRYSPITTRLEAERDRIKALLNRSAMKEGDV